MAFIPKHPLLAFREAHGLSQVQAAELAGITQAMWSVLEREAGFASPVVAKRLETLTGIRHERFMDFGDNQSAEAAEVVAAKPSGNPKDLP